MGRTAKSLIGIDGLKPCTKCATRLPPSAFSRDARAQYKYTKTSLQTWCKGCHKDFVPNPRQPNAEETRLCRKCNRELPLSPECFYMSKKSATGLGSWCKECRRKDASEWLKNNTAHGRSTRRAWKLKTKYRIDQDVYLRMMTEQSNRCAICKTIFIETPHIDHCHATMKVRGLLCFKCNNMLGLAKDSISAMHNAIRYITNAAETVPVRTRKEPGGPKIYFDGMSDLDKNLRHAYGITETDHTVIFANQDGICRLCEKPFTAARKPNVDHCHRTDIIRGLLCKLCNTFIGICNDNTKVLRAAIAYLQK